jgi:hypothetical protein
VNLGLIAIRDKKQKSPEDFNIFEASLYLGAQEGSAQGQFEKFSIFASLSNDIR